MTATEKRNQRNGLLFCLPWLIGFTVFCAYPIVASLYYSFCNYDGIRAPQFIGIENFRRLFLEDELFWKSMGNTLYMVAFGVPLSLLGALGAALLLNQKVRGLSIYRTVFYLPSIVPVVATSVLWMWIFNSEVGLIDVALRHLGVAEPPAWLTNPVWSKPALLIMGLWGVGGGMVIYLAALQNVPQALYEAASIDGAGMLNRFRNVTLPMITPVILFNVMMDLIGSFQYFTQAYVMTSGGPEDSTTFYALHLFNCAFFDFKMGYASAMAWVLFLVTLLFAVLLFRSSMKWVYYGGETR